MRTKNYLLSLLAAMTAAVLSVGMASCDDDEDPFLKVSDEKLSFEIKGDSKPVTIESNVGWTVASNKDWITVNQAIGNGNATIYIDVEENKEFGNERTGQVTITASEGGITHAVKISQKSIEAKLEVSPTSSSPVKGEGGTVNFTITSNVSWQVSSNQSWLSVDKSEGAGDGFVTATVAPNGESSSRSASLTFSDKDGHASSVTVTISQEPGGIVVSPTVISILGEKGSNNTVTVTATGAWSLVGCPEWLHASATSGTGTTTITLTALTENWSDEERSATLTFRTSTLSATSRVTQLGTLPVGLRVNTSDMTIMRDGFACDLSFGPNAKGYKEAFFTEAKYLTMTDRDIYNELMTQTEYDALEDYAFLPVAVNPGTKLIYCVAAYGNDNNDDGSHKYGPVTIERITTRRETLEDDMDLTLTYNSTQWKVIADRKGKYGQKCDEYYYIAAEDDLAETLLAYYLLFSDAFLAHRVFKPMIEENSNTNYKYGPQTMTWNRGGNKFFCTTWGKDRDTGEFSAELSTPAYRDLSDSSRKANRKQVSQAELNKPFNRPSHDEINKLQKALKIYKAK